MMAFYEESDVEKMLDEVMDWSERSQRLLREFIAHPARSIDGQEMIEHGFCRRLNDLDHFLTRLFEVLPPDQQAPSRETLKDATAFLQAFVINIYGASDNLAWIWAFEKPVIQPNGSELPAQWVGFRPSNTALRTSLEPGTKAYVDGLDEWFGYIEDYRHHLAHRIPLYIPQLTLDEDATAQLKKFQAEVMSDGWSLEAWFAVTEEMRRVGVFAPWMAHSVAGRRVPFHTQMICDFMTVVDLGERLLRDLKELPTA